MSTQSRCLLNDLSRTSVVKRLKQITLSAVPGWLGVRVSNASRYQHSVSVGKLSMLVSGGTKHEKLLLIASAILHDVGDGPFPHISDQIMKEKLGFTHEGALRFAFENSPSEDLMALSKHGLNLEEVSSVLEGRHRLSPLLYGFPDLDNADNIHRFMSTIPDKPLGEPLYNPVEVATSMSLENDTQRIPDDLNRRWTRDYGKVYEYVWNDRPNMICWTMLGRALRVIKPDLPPSFFRLTNREAFRFIQLKLQDLTNGLMSMKFNIVLDKEYAELKGEAQKLSEPMQLAAVEEILCSQAGLKGWSMGLTVDKPPSFKKPNPWRIYLVTYFGNEKPKLILEDLLSSSEPFQSKVKTS